MKLIVISSGCAPGKAMRLRRRWPMRAPRGFGWLRRWLQGIALFCFTVWYGARLPAQRDLPGSLCRGPRQRRWPCAVRGRERLRPCAGIRPPDPDQPDRED